MSIAKQEARALNRQFKRQAVALNANREIAARIGVAEYVGRDAETGQVELRDPAGGTYFAAKLTNRATEPGFVFAAATRQLSAGQAAIANDKVASGGCSGSCGCG